VYVSHRLDCPCDEGHNMEVRGGGPRLGVFSNMNQPYPVLYCFTRAYIVPFTPLKEVISQCPHGLHQL